MQFKDGDTATLKLRPGAYPDDHPTMAGQKFDRTVTGVIRSFEQDGETRWEISTGDKKHPAIGFDPDTAELM